MDGRDDDDGTTKEPSAASAAPAPDPSNWYARALFERAYGWEPATLVCSPPHAVFLGGVDPFTETPVDVAPRAPTLVVSFGDPAHVELLRRSRSEWPDGVEWYAAEIFDHPSYASRFRALALEAVETMERHRRSRRTSCIFVHCYMGISRSAAVVALFFMRVARMTLREALTALRWCRPCVCPNVGFLSELVALEIERGVGVPSDASKKAK